MSDGTVAKLEPRRPRRVTHGKDSYGERISSLEVRMGVVEVSAREAADNTRELLAIATATKGAAAFLRKHGPRAFAAITGAAVYAGWLNAGWGKFIGHLFSG